MTAGPMSDHGAATRRPGRRLLDVPEWLQRTAGWSWRILIVVITVWGAGWLFYRLRVVVLPVLVALMLASVLAPLVRRLNRRGVPLLLSTWAVLLFVGAFIGGVLFLAGWGLTAELTGDSARWEQVGNDVRKWLEDGPLGLSQENVAELEDRVREAVVGGVSSFGSDRARLLIEVASGLFLTVALTFFFVKDGPEMWAWVVRRVDPARRRALDEAGHAAVATLSAYLRAVALTGLIDAVVIGIGLYFIGVPLVIPLAIITFFAAFLPVVGATLAGGLAALVALVANGPGDAVLVVLLTLVVQQVEGDVIMPVIMGRQVPLHPAVVLASLAAGGALAGIIGAFVAVPVAAVATAALGVFRQHRTDRPAPVA